MLSRHFLRAKVLQSLYALQSNSVEPSQVRISFDENIAQLNNMGTLQLALLVKFRPVAIRALDDLSHKFLASDDERNPSTRIEDNTFLRVLTDNITLRHRIEALPKPFLPDEELLRRFFLQFRSSQVYLDYLNSEPSFGNDHSFVVQLFRTVINDELIRSAFFEQGVLWDDDFDQLAQYNFMMLKALDESFDADSDIPLMYDSRFEKDQEDYQFAVTLLQCSCQQHDANQQLIREHLNGWDFERVACVDLVLLNMAIAEVTTFPSIPERVTIDEYIELSKEFSTDRSKLFINGILDRIFTKLRVEGRISKSGRGLSYLEGYDTESDNSNSAYKTDSN